MHNQLKAILDILPAGDKVKLAILLGMMIFGAILEVVGIGMLPVFVAIIATPERVLELESLQPLLGLLNIEDSGGLLIWGSIALIVIFAVKNSYIVFFRFVEARFIYNRFRSISNNLFNRYLTSPYVDSLTRNSAELIRNVIGEAKLTVSNVLAPSLKLVKGGMIMLAIFLLLIIVEPLISVIVILLLGGVGAAFLKILKARMERYGQEAREDRYLMMKSVKEGLGGLKDVTVLNREGWFLEKFSRHIRRFAKAQIFKTVSGASTKPVIETLAVAGMLTIALVLYLQGRGMEVIIPVLTLFGAATVRLMPQLKEFISEYNNLRYYIYSADTVCTDLKGFIPRPARKEPYKPLPFAESIRFSDVSYSYPNADVQAVKSLSLEIGKGAAIGFVGPSGAGKTTIVDLILGLLDPQVGTIEVDGKSVSDHKPEWRANIGYIPQFIFLSDDTLRRNIAFGLPDDGIDDVAILEAVEAAQLSELVQSLEKGLETIIGERGVRLSGGQRQRIGIARALYHNPEVLIMDEATSALDNVTEKYVIEAIERFKGKRTIIMIAHRLTTVQNCDTLFFMKEGRITDRGTYDQLIAGNREFQKMAMIKVEN